MSPLSVFLLLLGLSLLLLSALRALTHLSLRLTVRHHQSKVTVLRYNHLIVLCVQSNGLDFVLRKCVVCQSSVASE